MIEIMNLNKIRPSEVYDFYVDRRTPVGNPDPIDENTTRDEVCDKYKIHFDFNVTVNNDPPLAFNIISSILHILSQFHNIGNSGFKNL